MKPSIAGLVAWIVLSLLTLLSFDLSWPILVSAALTVAVLYLAAWITGARGWPLFWMLFALYGGIGVVNIHIEMLVFNMASPSSIATLMMLGLAQAAVITGILAFGFGGPRASHALPPGAFSGRLWLRAPLVSLAYIVLYFVAGSIIYPYIRDFYASNTVLTIPPLGVIVATQFVRGLIYVGASAPFLHMMAGRRLQAGIVAGFALAILGGIGPLLLPVDEILPLYVRRIHMLEVGVSNFLLGFVAGLLLPTRTRERQRVHTA